MASYTEVDGISAIDETKFASRRRPLAVALTPPQAVFYLDHNYLENMLGMFRKVNARERVVGFYSTGPTARPNDLRIHDIVRRFAPAGATPLVFVIVDVRPDRQTMPTSAYRVVEEVDARTGGTGWR